MASSSLKASSSSRSVCATDQPTLDGQYTAFGRVVDGLEIVQLISTVEADTEGHPKARVVIKFVTIRDTAPPVPEPFVNSTAAEMAGYRAVLETSEGRSRCLNHSVAIDPYSGGG